MLKRPKFILGILWFVLAGCSIGGHIMEYKSGARPSGLKLVSATLNILTGILTLMSDALDAKREAVEPEVTDDFDLDDFEADSVDICDGDCENCVG